MPTGIVPLTVETKAISAQGGDRLIFNVPNDAPLASWGVRIKGNIVIGTAAATGAQSGGIANIIRQVQIQDKNEKRMNLLGRDWRILHVLQQQGSLQVTEPGLTVATQPFEIVLERYHQMPRMLQPWADQGILPNHLTRDVQVVLDIDPPTSVLLPAGTTTLAYSGVTCEFFVNQARPAPWGADFYINEQLAYIEDATIVTSTGRRDLRLNNGGRYRHLIMVCETTTASLRSFDDAVVNEIILNANLTQFCKVNWNALRSQNRAQFLLPSTLTGTAVLDWTKYFSPNELFDARTLENGGNDFKLTIEVVQAGTLFRVVPVRLFGNFVQIQGG